MRLQVQVEGSGKWPSDEQAFGKMKAALSCEISAGLETQFGLVSRVTERYTDVHVNSLALRMWLWSDRDAANASRAAKVRRSLPSSAEANSRTRSQ